MLLLSFAAVLLVAVLVSALAHRTILSTAALFLVAGFLLGPQTTGVLDVQADSSIVNTLAELALFAVLFTDGMRVGWQDLRSAWRLPGRALGWGLPLTLLITAVLAHYVAGLGWAESLLIGAVLAPTDPVFAAALVGNEKVPYRLRHLLNVESGINDGLALPFVILFLAIATGSGDLHLDELATELAVGLVIGVAVPALAIALERTRWFSASALYAPLNGVAIGLLVLALGQATHGNLFLAAFAAGSTIATFGPRQRAAFEHFGESVSELLKLAALLVFGALISIDFLGEISWPGWVFAVLAIFLARPVALAIAFVRSGLAPREQAAAMWFGPKGFASVVYGLIVLKSGIDAADEVFHLVALTIVISILLHSSTDVVIANAFDDERETPAWHDRFRRTRATPDPPAAAGTDQDGGHPN
ncbi:sodium/proton antiporter (CPA1 family) [Micromonospora sp. Llam0]|uniref:cation:proton antiporter n=1 Tax=Micromonospora sp. Llam0 TaxID=2485143 RepID=UPI000F460FB8|nr:cation:proton antiporter [Micromonospora sp. Llam0]ROO59517.1 sodium/proton antiporter (CPA1 family) [Micromonospora sp. Llam0]